MIKDNFVKAPAVVAARNTKIKADAVAQFHSVNNSEGVLITLCIDQKQSEGDAVASQNAIIEDLRKAKYSWMVCANAVYEYWGKSDFTENGSTTNLTNLKWNPHLHILTKKTGKLSVIRQHLARKFKDKKHGIYIFDVKKVPWNNGWDYIGGDKVHGKMNGVENDQKTREKYNIESIIII